MLNSFGTERGILTKRSRRKEVGGRGGDSVYCLLINRTLNENVSDTRLFSCDLDSLFYCENAHFHLSIGISSKELWATIWEDLQIWESFVGHKVYKILLLRLSRVRKYWLRLGAFDKFSIFGHLCSFCLLCCYQTVFLSSISPICGPRSGIIWRLRLVSCLSFHISGSPAIIQICLCSPSLARLALSFDNSSREEIVQMSDLASYVTHPGQWFGKTRVSVTRRAEFSSLKSSHYNLDQTCIWQDQAQEFGIGSLVYGLWTFPHSSSWTTH